MIATQLLKVAEDAVDWDLYPHFDPVIDAKLSCPCCGVARYSSRFLERLELARGFSGVVYPITSGYRCRNHDRAVHAEQVSAGTYTGTSSHIDGLAVDIAILDDEHRARVLYGLLKAGFERIGLGRGFIHADVDQNKPGRVAWMYCGGKTGSSAQRFALIRSILLDAHVRNFEIGRNYVMARTFAGSKDGVEIIV